MNRARHLLVPVLSAIALSAVLIGTLPGRASAQRVHKVRQGQTLSHIAHKYHVSVSGLRAANGMDRGDILRPGRLLTVPERGVVYVRRGQTLSHIARRHGVSVGELARANRMDRDDPLREGHRLVLPGFEAADKARRAARRWGRPDHPGRVTLVRMATGKRLRMRLLDNRGRVRPAAQARLSRLLHDRKTKDRHRIHPTLLRLITRISDHFGGRPLYVVSGYRDADAHRFTSRESRHTEGRAIDFRVAGVPNKVLRDYCRQLGNVGVGYYPRSKFVHLDVRREPGYWVDWSRPGEAPIYRRAGAGPPEADDDSEQTGNEREADSEETAAADGADETADDAT